MRVVDVDARRGDGLARDQRSGNERAACPIRCRNGSVSSTVRAARKSPRADQRCRDRRARPGAQRGGNGLALAQHARAQARLASRSAAPAIGAGRGSDAASGMASMLPHSKHTPRAPPIMAASTARLRPFLPMNHNHQHHRERRGRLIAQMRRQTGGGLASMPTAPEEIRNARHALPVPARQLFLLPVGFSGARGGGRRWSPARTRPIRSRSCSAATRTPSARSGTAFATAPTPRARSSASTRRYPIARARREAAPTGLPTGPRCTRRSASSRPGTSESPTLLNEVRNRVRTGIAAPEERSSTCASRSTRCASSRTSRSSR